MEGREREMLQTEKETKEERNEALWLPVASQVQQSLSSGSGNIPGWSDASHMMGDFSFLCSDRMTRSH